MGVSSTDQPSLAQSQSATHGQSSYDRSRDRNRYPSPGDAVLSSPPATPTPTPSPPSSPIHPLDPSVLAYAEATHIRDIGNPERVHHQTDRPETHGRDRFDIPGDRTSQRLAILADAAQPGQRYRQYVAPVVENLKGILKGLCYL